MSTAEDLKSMIREKYTVIATQSKEENATSCCGVGGCGDCTIFSEDYTAVEGYVPEADLGLGCGLPLAHLRLRKGETVLDLGSGAGNDAFIARAAVGEEGYVIGVDFTEAMIEKARANAERLGYTNVEFRHGDIEKLPVGPARVDVVTSNCVLNLVPDKKKAFSEIFRVLKPGGRFVISDVVLHGTLPEKIQNAAEMIAGCVSGALQRSQYLSIIYRSGFEQLQIVKERVIELPDDILLQYLTPEELKQFRESGTEILSITVTGEKPAASCGCGTGCC
jgi:ubiquinone/menaquinone biosynthesis C-methylase UbiE